MRNLTTFIAITTSVIAYILYKAIKILEIGKEVNLFNYESCKIIGDMIGPEDLRIYKNFIITGSDDRLKLFQLKGYNAENVPNGGIYAINIDNIDNYNSNNTNNEDNANNNIIEKIEIESFPDEIAFHPLGIYIKNNEIDELYAINNAYSKGGTRIEVIQISLNNNRIQLKYLRSLLFPAESFSGILNSLVVFSKDEYLVTSWLPFVDPPQGKDHSLFKFFKFLGNSLLELERTHVYYCKGINSDGYANCKQVENTEGIINNGIAYDNKDTIYVADVAKKQINVFKIINNQLDNLKLVDNIVVGYGIDNIHYDNEKEVLYVSLIGKIKDFIDFTDEARRIGGRPMNIDLPGGGAVYDIKKKKLSFKMMQKDYYGIGSLIEFRNKYIAGSWGDTGILICDK